MDEIIQYVAGFLFTPSQEQVVLVSKNRSDGQVGVLGGVGGKIESGELPRQAMSREFEAETGIKISEKEWRALARLEGFNFQVYFFFSVSEKALEVKSKESEQVALYPVDQVFHLPLIANLRWLIPLAMDKRVRFPIVFEDIPT